MQQVKKYGAILSDLERLIGDGHYSPGSKLPSVRAASARYGCSVSTVLRAYAELEKRHAIYSVPQSGYYVVDKAGDVRQGGNEGKIDFAPASPDLDIFPYQDFQHCLNKAIDTHKYNLFTYGDPQGLESLRRTLAAHLADAQVFAGPQRIFVTSGAQQALEIFARMPYPSGRPAVLVEQPSYDYFLRYLEQEGIPVRTIARTARGGVDLAALERAFAGGDVKMYYTMSRHHNPLGTSLGGEERRAIARLAGKYDVYVVEDDYMADLGTVERRYDPIHAYPSDAHVVYLKSFSKIIFPGLRLGAAVVPERLTAAFRSYRTYGDTSLLSQAALEVYIKNGMYERHKHAIRSRYEERMQLLQAAAKTCASAGTGDAEASGIRVPEGCSGIYMPFLLPQTVNLERLTMRLAERGVQVVSGKSFYLASYLERDKFLRISISRVRHEQIETGVRIIAEEVRRRHS